MFDKAAFSPDLVQHSEEHGYTGASETINRLLRITDDHELSRGKAAGTISIFGQHRNDFGLYLVRVLEFVDEQRLKMLPVMIAYRGVVFEQVAHAEQKIVEVERV